MSNIECPLCHTPAKPITEFPYRHCEEEEEVAYGEINGKTVAMSTGRTHTECKEVQPGAHLHEKFPSNYLFCRRHGFVFSDDGKKIFDYNGKELLRHEVANLKCPHCGSTDVALAYYLDKTTNITKPSGRKETIWGIITLLGLIFLCGPFALPVEDYISEFYIWTLIIVGIALLGFVVYSFRTGPNTYFCRSCGRRFGAPQLRK